MDSDEWRDSQTMADEDQHQLQQEQELPTWRKVFIIGLTTTGFITCVRVHVQLPAPTLIPTAEPFRSGREHCPAHHPARTR